MQHVTGFNKYLFLLKGFNKENLNHELLQIIADELNVKKIELGEYAEGDGWVKKEDGKDVPEEIFHHLKYLHHQIGEKLMVILNLLSHYTDMGI